MNIKRGVSDGGSDLLAGATVEGRVRGHYWGIMISYPSTQSTCSGVIASLITSLFNIWRKDAKNKY